MLRIKDTLEQEKKGMMAKQTGLEEELRVKQEDLGKTKVCVYVCVCAYMGLVMDICSCTGCAVQDTRAVRITSTWLAGITSVQERSAELRGQLGVVEENKHELEALRLKCSSAVVEKTRAEEKLLAASNQVLKLEEEAAEAKRQLREAEVRM